MTIIASLGQSDADIAPSAAVVAAGPTRYIQLVNSRFGIYAYNSGNPIAQGTLAGLTGVGIGKSYSPQIIWDSDTNRFYYATAVNISTAENFLTFGWSKTATPVSAVDFCHYFLPLSNVVPTTVSLGDTQNRLLIANEGFDGTSVGTDLTYIAKPPPGETCPNESSLSGGRFLDVQTAGDVRAHSLVVANQIDGSTTGYAVSSSLAVFAFPSTALTLYKLEETGAGMTMWILDLTVPAYAIPADAEQPDTLAKLDTGLAGPTQAVSAIDPSQGGIVALWTQHTVLGGAGASVRWYQINPATPSVLQTEAIASPNASIFNAAISPDRVAIGETRRFGGNMGLGLNASASNLRASVLAASKVGTEATAFKFVAVSPAATNEDCVGGTACRWGSAGASPVPADMPSWTEGRIVHSASFVQSAGSPTASGWGTLNMYIGPQ
jgi:hypothetical protein